MVQFDDGVEGAVDEPFQLGFACADFGLGPQALQLRRGPRREDLKQREAARPSGHGFGIHDREMTEDTAVEVLERHAHVAYGIKPWQVVIARKEMNDVVGIVNQPGVFYHRLARRSLDFVGVVFDKAVDHPEG